MAENGCNWLNMAEHGVKMALKCPTVDGRQQTIEMSPKQKKTPKLKCHQNYNITKKNIVLCQDYKSLALIALALLICQVSIMSLLECGSVLVVALARGGSAINGATELPRIVVQSVKMIGLLAATPGQAMFIILWKYLQDSI